MESWQVYYINENLPTLIKTTKCDSSLLAHLISSRVLCDRDVQLLERVMEREGAIVCARKLFRILKTKVDSYDKLCAALSIAKQSGAQQILDKGYEWKSSLRPDFDFGNECRGIWFNVKYPVPGFVGREDELRKLHEILTMKNGIPHLSAISINGPSGIGKTQFCLQYIKEYKGEYDDVIWLDAKNKYDLLNLFHNLADQELVATKSLTWCNALKETSVLLSQIYGVLSPRKCLLVFDDAEDKKLVDEFLPFHFAPMDNTNITLVLISSEVDWEDRFIKSLVLDGIKKDDAAEYAENVFLFASLPNVPTVNDINIFISSIIENNDKCSPSRLQLIVETARREFKRDPNFKLSKFDTKTKILP